MRYLALATDYDGTLAHDGRVDADTIDGLKRLVASGRHLLLVTGRELEELIEVLPELGLFELVVAENGALLYRPSTREQTVLGHPPPARFVDELTRCGVSPLSVGRSIVATVHPHETTVLSVIRDLGLELQVIFNKGAVMVLPAGVNKASGLTAALRQLGLSRHNVVAVGDGENDHALLKLAECGVAVSNAIPTLKETADWTTAKDHGAGVVELIDAMIKHDLEPLEAKLSRHHILLGTRDDGEEARFSPYGRNILIAGSSGSGKSTVATSIMERLCEHGYQFCIIDPEGDYENVEPAVALGTSERAPTVVEVLEVLEMPDENAVVNLVGLPLQDRPAFFLGLLPRLQELRAKLGRPHWILVDETHHLLPRGWDPASLTLSHQLFSMLFITVHPDQVARYVLDAIDMTLTLGEAPDKTMRLFLEAIGHRLPAPPSAELEPGDVLMMTAPWTGVPSKIRIAPARTERRRHRRKYAAGELPPEHNFFFRGPEGKLNLRVQNLLLFMQIADGVDDDTWQHHLRQGDYSRWFREAIKDDALAQETKHIESHVDLPPAESRRRIRALIEQHYTMPA